MDRKMKGEKLDENRKKDSACCVRIINHRGRKVCPYPQKAKRGDSASDNSEGRRETHFVARL